MKLLFAARLKRDFHITSFAVAITEMKQTFPFLERERRGIIFITDSEDIRTLSKHDGWCSI